ncbi:hypothetical protein ACQPYK_24215 [Streptosporangium sp. CA-135522]|uniref:hypothetical protein n=1 Tax=Streptosporangium sp. CA-135522 TaxID=3240072 RepID=UPI003D8F2695
MSTDRQTILIEGYETIRTLLADARLSSAPPDGQAGFGGRHMLNTDPPDHTRLRKLAQKAFTARRVAALRPRIQQITDALIAGICPQGKADLVGDVAFPLATTVICELLGVPAADRTTFSDWFTAALTPADTPDADVIVGRALKTLNDYIQTLVDAKRGSGERAGGGWVDFAEVEPELARWIAARAFTTGEGPKALFDAAVAELRTRPVVKASGPQMDKVLKRVAEITTLGVGEVDVSVIPPQRTPIARRCCGAPVGCSSTATTCGWPCTRWSTRRWRLGMCSCGGRAPRAGRHGTQGAPAMQAREVPPVVNLRTDLDARDLAAPR